MAVVTGTDSVPRHEGYVEKVDALIEKWGVNTLYGSRHSALGG